ncbi:MAG: hypothetical protein NTU88_13695 [Armatimonadetes bacterium]|nr:hypothetical protein [Armatimonadota bacterium]
MSGKLAETRSVRLPAAAPLDYAPENEQGVVFLFSQLAKRFGLHVERLQRGYPDCTAYQSDGERVRIEFEYRSHNFVPHRHNDKKCDCIVCWIHDWPGVPEHIRVIELRKEFGLGWAVWFQPIAAKFCPTQNERSGVWSVSRRAAVGDLLLFYRMKPDSFVKDIFRVATPVRSEECNPEWKEGEDWMTHARRVATLKSPLHFSQFKQHPVLGNANFVRGRMQGQYRATAYWPELYRMIIDCNPGLQKALRRFEPSRVL